MRRKQNVIIFSAGESVRNGNVDYIKTKLEEKGIMCFDWRSLFKQAHNSEQIALLPSLSKKIPTFDFALIVAEAVDSVKLRGGEEQGAIRDNVIFELGLCVMALGSDRVILLVEEGVHIPEDLIGVGKIGIACVPFRSLTNPESIHRVSEIIENRSDVFSERFTAQLDEIIEHIRVKSELISPVFVGAAVSSAEAYFLNFIVRLLENTDKGFSFKNSTNKTYPFPKEVKITIYIPTTVDSLTRSAISEFYGSSGYEEFVIQGAGIRDLFFYGKFDPDNNTLSVADIPTSITASYTVVNSVLNIDSDDEYDLSAEERFAVKEMDIYAFALKKLLTADVACKRLSFIQDPKKKQRILDWLPSISIEFKDIRKPSDVS